MQLRQQKKLAGQADASNAQNGVQKHLAISSIVNNITTTKQGRSRLSLLIVSVLIVGAYTYHNKLILSQILLEIDHKEVGQVKAKGEKQKSGIIENHETKVHPRLPFPPEILNIIKSTNSSDYSWVGNQFIPPPGVPVFTPSQIRYYFQNRNVLFLGDSTNRRVYGTMKAILTAEDPDDVPLEILERLSKRRRPSEDAVALGGFEKNLTSASDAAKFRAVNNGILGCGNRAIKQVRLMQDFGCGNVPGSVAENYAMNHPDPAGADDQNNTEKMMKQRKGLFDLGLAYCFHNIMWYFNDTNSGGALLTAMKDDYDLIIINAGIWEPLKMDVCRRNANSGLGLLPVLLDELREKSSKDLQIVFRTSSFADEKRAGKDTQKVSSEFINYTKQYFYNMTVGQRDNSIEPKPNITIVDFGGVMIKRSFREKRIVGDHIAHYGIEARLLYVQQLMHELIKADLENW